MGTLFPASTSADSTGLAAPFKVFLATGCPESTRQVATIDDVADLAVRESMTFINSASEEDMEDLKY